MYFSLSRLLMSQALTGALFSLAASSMVLLDPKSSEAYFLTVEGMDYASKGSPEAQLFKAVPREGISKDELFVGISRSLSILML
jgi:phenylalanyl-tRNA synthetase alpha chain